ncbi:hypothetical protein [Leptothrix ochracea]|jgi:hypothetical protein|uniref:hypothetical protein n=1 Tax=Leptothrix ochracea TaxID=735331 RepID=UPI0034E2A8B6
MSRIVLWSVAGVLGLTLSSAHAQDRQVYRCPGNLYTDQISVKEAAARGCKTLDGAPVTVVQSSTPRRAGSSAAGGASGPASAVRVDPAEQRARDSDARRILEAELRKDEERLAQMQKDYNGGEPERRGEERNFSRYQERVADMKAAIARKEADIAAIRRELSKVAAP